MRARAIGETTEIRLDFTKAALKEEITAGLEGIRQGNHSMLLQLVAELVLAEVKLFQHQRD